jgi:cytochrome c55X
MRLLAGVALSCLLFPGFAQPLPSRQAALVELVRQDCGACHGLTLKGGLGPPLVPGALEGKDASYLGYVILHGRGGTPMPPWRGLLSEEEAQWIAEQLKQGLSR